MREGNPRQTPPPPEPGEREGAALSPEAYAALQGLMKARRRLNRQIADRALEGKATAELEAVLDSIQEKIMWTLEQDLGL